MNSITLHSMTDDEVRFGRFRFHLDRRELFRDQSPLRLGGRLSTFYTRCQSTKQGRYKIVPGCRLLRRDASKGYGNCTERNRNPLHVPSKVTP
jgi:hypothetical protein